MSSGRGGASGWEVEGVAGVSTALSPAQRSLCQCRGNCGTLACDRAKRNLTNQKKRSKAVACEVAMSARAPICESPCLAGFEFCMYCKCEKAECHRTRIVHKRWCGHHVKLQRDLKEGESINAYGQFTLDPEWSWPLQMVAIHGWTLSGMCPCDLKAFIETADKLGGHRTKVDGHFVLQLWAAAFLQWPRAVAAWADVVMGMPGIFTGVPGSGDKASHYASAALTVASECDSDDMPWMHDQISTGNTNVLFGPVVWLAKLGMNPSAENRKRQTGKAPDLATEVRLGKRRRIYSVEPQTAVWTVLVDLADRFDREHPGGMAFPSTFPEARRFIKTIVVFLEGFPRTFGYGSQAPSTPEGGGGVFTPSPVTDHASHYCRKHITRKIALWVQTRTPNEVWMTSQRK